MGDPSPRSPFATSSPRSQTTGSHREPRSREGNAGQSPVGFALAPGRRDREQWRKFYCVADRALFEASCGEVLPVVLAGVRTSTAVFEDVSCDAPLVIGRIHGAHEHATAHDLGRAAWPLLRDRLRAQRLEAIAKLRGALAAGRVVTGIDEVWQLGCEGRGRAVIVKEDYRAEPSVELDGRLVAPNGSDDRGMDDPVDELVEHVVRGGGTAEFVASGALTDLGHIGLVLR